MRLFLSAFTILFTLALVSPMPAEAAWWKPKDASASKSDAKSGAKADAKTASADSKTAGAKASAGASTAKPEKALRIFLKIGGKKVYVRGFQWMSLDLNRKIGLIESARRGAGRMGAVMTFPAEIYVREVNKFFQENPMMQQMEVGQVIQGIAISMKDWDAA